MYLLLGVDGLWYVNGHFLYFRSKSIVDLLLGAEAEDGNDPR
jgi:hypothetical protein